jgi:hypothetical protein
MVALRGVLSPTLRGILGGVFPRDRSGAFDELTDLDWYVDSVNGDDGNDGTTAADAFQTIAKLQTVLAEGEKVGLVRDSHWREMLGQAISFGTEIPDNCEFFSVGSGRLPTLDAGDILPSSGWTLKGGTSNTWQRSFTPEHDGSDGGITMFRTPSGSDIETEYTRLDRAAVEGDVESTPGSYYAPALSGAGSYTVSVYSTVDPATDGATWEISTRRTAFSTNGANILVDGLRCRRCNSLNGAYVRGLGSSPISRNVVAEDGVSHTFFQSDGERTTCRSIGNKENDLFNAYSTSNTDLGTFDGCIAIGRDDPTSAAGGVGATGFFCHTDTVAKFATVMVRNCKAVRVDAALKFADMDELVVRGFACWKYTTNKLNAAVLDIDDMRAYGHDDSIIAPSLATSLAQSQAATGTIRNSIFTGSRVTGKTALSHNAGLLNVVLENVAIGTIGAQTNGAPTGIYSHGLAGSSVKLNDCLFVSTSTNASRVGIRTDANSEVAAGSDNNTYDSDAYDMRQSGSASATIAAWQTAVDPIDANSTVESVTITDDQAEQRELAGMVRFSGHNGKGPDMTEWNEELDPDVLLAEALAL